MLKRIYLEITNVCNLRCSFCPGTRREPKFMRVDEFSALADKLQGYTRFLYFHLMGEPLLHPDLGQLLDIAHAKGFRVIITTNGTLLSERAEALLSSPALYQLNISLQSFEGSGMGDLNSYLETVCAFAKKASEKGIYCSLRLWNEGGDNTLNGRILAALHEHFPGQWEKCLHNMKLFPGVFLEHGDKFDWPDMDAAQTDVRFCHALRNQAGVLCDGTVVPCCLDSEGSMALGNLNEQSMEDILSSPRARAIYEGFSRGRAAEELCRHCGYAGKF